MADPGRALPILFAAAVRGDRPAAQAFAVALVGHWPALLAEWEANARAAWVTWDAAEAAIAAGEWFGANPEPDVPALELAAPGGPAAEFRLTVSGPAAVETDPGEWEPRVAVAGEWRDRAAGPLTPGVWHFPPPSAWQEHHRAWVADYLVELSRQPADARGAIP